MLRAGGYDVVSTADPLQALEIVAHKPSPDLLLSDLEMPCMRGTELVREISRIAPGMGTVLMTGGSADPVDVPPGTPLLQKPFSARDLLSLVQTVLGQSARARTALRDELVRSAELRRHGQKIVSALTQTIQGVPPARAHQTDPAVSSNRASIEVSLTEELRAAQSDWFEAARTFFEFCANFERAKEPSNRRAALARLHVRQRESFEKYQRAAHALTALLLSGGKKGSVFESEQTEPRITEREVQVLKELAEGKTTKQIANELNISFKTAATPHPPSAKIGGQKLGAPHP
jgi:DNA-binding NarL/FixJ family response regulator